MLRRRKRKLILFIVELAVLAVVIVLLIFYQKLNRVNIQSVDGSKIAVNDIDEDTLIEFTGYETIAVFGLDNRETGNYDWGNSDVIMIININNDTNEIKMISVYRDTFLNIAAAGEAANYQKANAAFAYGGVSQGINMLNQNLDLAIDNYLCVDFKAVAEAINILGGVDIDIDSEYELNYLNDYILATNDILGTNSPTLTSTGLQTLDGTQAVAYTRIRYTSGGDYKRAYRQRVVLSEMMSKAKDANLSQLTELLDAILPDISTDLSQKELLSMAMTMLSYDISDSQGFPFERTDMTLDPVGSIVVPCDLETNVIELHSLLFGAEDYQPSPQVVAASEYIVERTGMTVGDEYVDQFSYSDDAEYGDDVYVYGDSSDDEDEDEYNADEGEFGGYEDTYE
ncbi:MAG: LCP family protein [Lachnospiraceae bacterium]|nr:LCP family protein [Lachnospiraceae bacterium]